MAVSHGKAFQLTVGGTTFEEFLSDLSLSIDVDTADGAAEYEMPSERALTNLPEGTLVECSVWAADNRKSNDYSLLFEDVNEFLDSESERREAEHEQNGGGNVGHRRHRFLGFKSFAGKREM